MGALRGARAKIMKINIDKLNELLANHNSALYRSIIGRIHNLMIDRLVKNYKSNQFDKKLTGRINALLEEEKKQNEKNAKNRI